MPSARTSPNGEGLAGSADREADERFAAAQWRPPSLEETLRASEGEHKLRKPHLVGLVRGRSSSGARDGDAPPGAALQGAGPFAPAGLAWLLSAVAAQLEGLLPAQWEADVYWREWLERTMDGPVVAAVIGAAIFLDALLLVYFEAALTGDDTSAAVVAASSVVLALFVLELALRNAAQGRRFWGAPHNVFDAGVVGASVAMAAANRTFEARLAQAPPDSAQRADLRGVTDVLKVIASVLRGLCPASAGCPRRTV